MTEKRFRISQGYTDRFCHDWKKNKLLNFKQTIDCLNTFYEENEQLKSYTGEMEDYLARLEEKNEELKADKQALIDFIKKEFPKSHKHILEGFE